MTTETEARATVRDSDRVVIRTKYHGPTDYKGSRISVAHGQGGCGAGKRTWVSWDYALNSPENHAQAIQAHLDRMGWGGEWVIGADDTGYVAVRSGR